MLYPEISAALDTAAGALEQAREHAARLQRAMNGARAVLAVIDDADRTCVSAELAAMAREELKRVDLLTSPAPPAVVLEVSCDDSGALTVRADADTLGRIAGRAELGNVDAARELLRDRVAGAWYAAGCPAPAPGPDDDDPDGGPAAPSFYPPRFGA